MIELQYDLSELERAATYVGGVRDQLEYAISVAMNKSIDVTERYVANVTWPNAVNVRNRSFMSAALMQRRSTKRNLSVELYDGMHRGHLTEHARGGVVRPRGKKLAVPFSSNVKRTARGVTGNDKPKASGMFRVKNYIVKRQGKGRKARLVYKYHLERDAMIKPTFAFDTDARRVFTDTFKQAFPVAVELAMRSAKRK